MSKFSLLGIVFLCLRFSSKHPVLSLVLSISFLSVQTPCFCSISWHFFSPTINIVYHPQTVNSYTIEANHPAVLRQLICNCSQTLTTRHASYTLSPTRRIFILPSGNITQKSLLQASTLPTLKKLILPSDNNKTQLTPSIHDFPNAVFT